MDKKIIKALEDLNKMSQKSIGFTGNDLPEVESLPTGIQTLDHAFGIGGLPKGRITEIFGQPGSAKTSLSLFMIANAQRQGLSCMFVDAERALDIQVAKNMGVNVNELIVIQPDCGEEAIEAAENFLRQDLVTFVVIDSVPSLLPRSEAEAEVGKPTMGGQARFVSSALRKLVPVVSSKNAVLIFVNQLRVNIMGGQYDPFTRPGGMAMKFYTTIQLQLTNTDKLVSKGEQVGQRIKFKFKKNKVASTKEEGVMDLMYATGFVSQLDIVDAGIKKGVLHKNGNTHFFGKVKLAVGKEKTLEFIDADPALKAQILQALEQ